MQPADITLPYFDMLLAQLAQGDPTVTQAFGRHVHWGYWPQPQQATRNLTEFAQAAETLCQRVYAHAVRKGDRILDTGCGFGGTIASLNEQYGQLQLVGLNIDARQLARAQQMVQPRAHNQIEWVVGDACQLPFADATFNVVLAVECIFHFPSRQAFFQEAKRVLRPGGKLAICDFVPLPIFQSIRALGEYFFRDPIGAVYGRVDSSFTQHDYQQLATDTGFNLTRIEDITTNTLPTYPVVQQVFQQMGHPDAAQATAAVALVSRLSLLRYLILNFVAH